MRGPGYKLSGDVRRTWRCPKCGKERKLMGDVTSLACGCTDNPWMQIVAERTMEPRPLQRPSDIERRPIDFGIEPPPKAPERPEATIIKPAISKDVDLPPANPVEEPRKPEPTQEPKQKENEEEWGEGIL